MTVLFALSLSLPLLATAQTRLSSNSITPASTPATVAGQVINAVTGLPVRRALVRFSSRAVLTDHEGKFVFEQVSETAGNLQVIKPGYSMTNDPTDPGNQFVQVSQLAGPIELGIYPEALLTGNVAGPDGQPLDQINVTVRRSVFDDSGRHWIQAGQTQTNLHGDFRLPVPAGDYRLATRYVPRYGNDSEAVMPVVLPAPGGGVGGQSIHLHSGEEQHFDVRPAIRRVYPVSIGVESRSERGIPVITARSSDGTTFNAGIASNRREGHASLSLPTGSYDLSAKIQTQDGTEIAETKVTVTGAETDDSESAGVVLRFVLVPSIPVEVAIDPSATSDNNVQSAAPAMPTPQQFGLSLQKIDQDDEDAGSIPLVVRPNSTPVFNAPPGTYRLVAHGQGRWFIRTVSYGTSDLIREHLVVASGAGSATIRLLVSNQTGALQGLVKLNGQPAAACWIYLIADSPSATPVINIRSGSSGSFSSAYLPSGTYRAIAFEHRHAADFTDPDILAAFSTYVQPVTVTVGGQSAVNLNAVSQSELKP